MILLIFQWMHSIHHIVKIITQLMEGHENWIEVSDVQEALKRAKAKVQEALKPGKFPGGTREDNLGVAFDFPDAKV